jgi:hypothetical protein
MSDVKLHADVKAFDHKPEKRGSDGKIISARYHSMHIVNGVSFMSFYDAPHEFYHENGKAIPLAEVPDVCKQNIKNAVVPKPNPSVVIKSSKKSVESSDSSDSIV